MVFFLYFVRSKSFHPVNLCTRLFCALKIISCPRKRFVHLKWFRTRNNLLMTMVMPSHRKKPLKATQHTPDWKTGTGLIQNQWLHWLSIYMQWSTADFYYGCVRLASSLGWAPLTRAKRTTTHRCRSDFVYLGQAPKWPTPQVGHWGLTWVSPWNDVKSYSNAPGQTGDDPGKLNERTH